MLAPGGRFVLFLNHPLLQTPGSGWIDDQILDPPEQYWRIGPYLTEASTIEQVESGRVHPLRAPAAEPLRQRHGRAPGWSSSAWSSRRRRPASWPGRSEYADAATIPRLLVLVAAKR